MTHPKPRCPVITDCSVGMGPSLLDSSACETRTHLVRNTTFLQAPTLALTLTPRRLRLGAWPALTHVHSCPHSGSLRLHPPLSNCFHCIIYRIGSCLSPAHTPARLAARSLSARETSGINSQTPPRGLSQFPLPLII